MTATAPMLALPTFPEYATTDGEPMLPLPLYAETVALALNPDGTVYDEAFTWETAVSIAETCPELTVVAVADDGYRSREEIQAMIRSVVLAGADCWGAVCPTATRGCSGGTGCPEWERLYLTD